MERWAWKISQDKPQMDMVDSETFEEVCPIPQGDEYGSNNVVIIEPEELKRMGYEKLIFHLIGEIEYRDIFGSKYAKKFHVQSPNMKEVYWHGLEEIESSPS